VKSIGRLLLLTGAAGVVSSAFLPWVTINAKVPIDLSTLGVNLSPGLKTVSGTDTSIWPIVTGVGGLVAALALLNFARKLLVLVGLLIAAAGAGLLYYTLNVVDFETASRSALEQVVAGTVLTSSAEAGPPLLLGSGLLIMLGALLRS
jgi:tryptophan-associated transmembrane protein